MISELVIGRYVGVGEGKQTKRLSSMVELMMERCDLLFLSTQGTLAKLHNLIEQSAVNASNKGEEHWQVHYNNVSTSKRALMIFKIKYQL